MIIDGKKIAFLGDSITFGACLADVNDSYVSRVKRSADWAALHNHSLSGSRIGEYIGQDPRNIGPSFVKRFPDMPDGMDIVMVFGGTNDFGIGNEPIGEITDETAETFNGALNILMKGLKKKYPDAFITFMTPLHRRTEAVPNEFTGSVLAEYIGAIKERAAHYGFHILDLHEVESLQPTDEYYKTMILGDGIHPNEKGHAAIAEEVIRYLTGCEESVCGGAVGCEEPVSCAVRHKVEE